MPRVLCQRCQRPEIACICAFAIQVNNHTQVLILQHPSEVKQAKGTVALLQQSLAKCQVIVGEDFNQHQALRDAITRYGNKIALLYPSEQAVTLSLPTEQEQANRATAKSNSAKLNDLDCIIILDGTWKKAYRMYKLNSSLQRIKHIMLPLGINSLYQIRKTKKNNALSSLEACCHALASIENQPEKYQPLLNKFVKFNDFQQNFSVAAKS
ncbi:DTW domain-containing protein YfiP [Colwellia chukchiensis]|uniref:tRNA-uridine aminocarboxypropyltransferase n=2 Tax=Colwellia chukchiensis TaxID=641665 RepID=A0A1H7LW54_9GAMM|nr:DTW domain-containing protein YfiP [Colwellia chukchiensis]